MASYTEAVTAIDLIADRSCPQDLPPAFAKTGLGDRRRSEPYIRAQRRFRYGAAIVSATLATALVFAPSSRAAPVDMAPQQYVKDTSDGWHLTLSIHDERVNSVPNLAEASNSREGFVTFSATASASGGSSPITDSLFIAGYQLGCQSDVSSGLGIGGIATGSGNIGLPSTAATAGGSLTGFVQTVVQPGVITDLPMSNMVLNTDGRGELNIDNIHVKADACGGDVTVRSYAYLRISTAAAHSSFAVYGDPIKI